MHELTQGKLHIRPNAAERGPPPNLAASFFNQRHVPELTAGRPLRTSSRHAIFHEIVDPFFEMLVDGNRQIVITPAASEQLFEPLHLVAYASATANTRVIPANIFSKLETSCCRCRMPISVSL